MTTVTAEVDVKGHKDSTQLIITKINDLKGIVLESTGSSVIADGVFEKTLPEGMTADTVASVLSHINDFNAAAADVATSQAVPFIVSNPEFTAELSVPLVKGSAINLLIEGTKETSDGKGGRQTVHGSVASKLTVRGWKAGGFGIVKSQFRAACTAGLNK